MLYLARDAYTESTNWSQNICKMFERYPHNLRTDLSRVRARNGTMSVYSVNIKAEASNDIQNINQKTVHMYGL